MKYEYFIGYTVDDGAEFKRETIELDFKILVFKGLEDIIKLEDKLKEIHGYDKVTVLSFTLIQTIEG